MFSIIKSIHIACALLSISGFIYRGILKFKNSEKLNKKWLKVSPHIIDTALLASAIYLVSAGDFLSEPHAWIHAKIVLLVLYIVFGLMTLRFCKTMRMMRISFVLAIACFASILAIAQTKTVWFF